MRPIDFGLLVVLAIMAFIAVASEKKVLVAEGHAYTQGELDHGRRIYEDFCRSCHEEGDGGAPPVGNTESWQKRSAQGMTVLIAHAVEGYRGDSGWMPPKGGEPSLTPQEVALAVAFMVSRTGARVPL